MVRISVATLCMNPEACCLRVGAQNAFVTTPLSEGGDSGGVGGDPAAD